MKINIITTLLFALHASTASGFAINGDCDDFGINTDQDCNAKCNNLSGRGGWEGFTRGPSDNITECSCTLQASREAIRNGLPAENHFKCTRDNTPEPVDPVHFTGDCDDFGITDWPGCNNQCIKLAANRGYAAHTDGGRENISACYCNYGRQRENSFTCTREPTFPPIPSKRTGLCSDDGIEDQETCFDFCQKYQRLPQYVGNDNGLLWCRCRREQGGEPDFECRGDQNSYLRSG